MSAKYPVRMIEKAKIVFLLILTLSIFSCKRKGCTDPTSLNYDPQAKVDDGSCIPQIDQNSDVFGFGILSKLVGIWNGPVSSPTPLGSFPEWIVDFRPISSSQISAKNELDSLNDIFMSFFICRIENEQKIAFRNGGGFAGNVRNSYMIVDSVSELSSHSYYRFSDPVSGGIRVYTEITFKGDSIRMHTYTNKFNTLSRPETHMVWTADKRDSLSAIDASALFSFPQKQLTKDFTSTFDGLTDAVFYAASSDPYPEQEQPHLGVGKVNIEVSPPIVSNVADKILIMITTRPLFSGFNFIPSSLNTRSRYVIVNAENPTSFQFDYMHPGTYYVNAIYDSNGDFQFSSGDFMNSNFDVQLNLASKGNEEVSVNINWEIP